MDKDKIYRHQIILEAIELAKIDFEKKLHRYGQKIQQQTGIGLEPQDFSRLRAAREKMLGFTQFEAWKSSRLARVYSREIAEPIEFSELLEIAKAISMAADLTISIKLPDTTSSFTFETMFTDSSYAKKLIEALKAAPFKLLDPDSEKMFKKHGNTRKMNALARWIKEHGFAHEVCTQTEISNCLAQKFGVQKSSNTSDLPSSNDFTNQLESKLKPVFVPDNYDFP